MEDEAEFMQDEEKVPKPGEQDSGADDVPRKDFVEQEEEAQSDDNSAA